MHSATLQSVEDSMVQGRYKEALVLLEKAQAEDPQNPSLNRMLGILSFRLKDYPRAVEFLQKYVDHNPDLEDIWLYLTLAQKRIGAYTDALASSQMLQEINPTHISNLIHQADLFRKLGEIGKARFCIHSVLQMDPGNHKAQELMTSFPSG